MKNCYRDVRLDSGHIVVSFYLKDFFYRCSQARSDYYLSNFSNRDLLLFKVDESLSCIEALYNVGAISETLFNWLVRYRKQTFDYCFCL